MGPSLGRIAAVAIPTAVVVLLVNLGTRAVATGSSGSRGGALAGSSPPP
jgi:hypothetical protein